MISVAKQPLPLSALFGTVALFILGLNDADHNVKSLNKTEKNCNKIIPRNLEFCMKTNEC